jgi:hypothetical protein
MKFLRWLRNRASDLGIFLIVLTNRFDSDYEGTDNDDEDVFSCDCCGREIFLNVHQLKRPR